MIMASCFNYNVNDCFVVVWPWYCPEGSHNAPEAEGRGSLRVPEGQYLGHTTTSNHYLIY